MSFDVNLDREAKLLLLTFTIAELDMVAVPELKEALADRLLPGMDVVVDLGRVEFIDSSGAGALLWLRRRAIEVGSDVVLCRLSSQVQQVLDSLRFSRLFKVASSVDGGRRLLRGQRGA